MKKCHSLIAAALAVMAAASCSSGETAMLVEAESFMDKGGWVVDQQFMDRMGSPYVLAHGKGIPVEDCSTEIKLPGKGEWHAFVRTYNWTSPWCSEAGPGCFQLAVNGNALDTVLGNSGDRWQWQYAGAIDARSRKVAVSLHDLTGFDGRCDAIYFSRASEVPELGMDELRETMDSKWNSISKSEDYDFVVVGGGVAGMCAAVSAARLGLRTALVHDRPVPGGNNSAEVRVHLGGWINVGPYPNLGNMVKEFGHSKKGNAQAAENYEDEKKIAFLDAEPLLTRYMSNRVVKVTMDGSKIKSVIARNIETGELTELCAPLFSDCTGDANLGVLAGAEWCMGREGKDDFGEAGAPEKGDSLVMGSSVQWNTKRDSVVTTFPEFHYGIEFCDASARHVKMGEWTWETGMNRNQIDDAEQIRDYALLIVYSNWSFLKNEASDKDDFAFDSLDWVSFIAGKRESRRLIGDYVLTGTDVIEGITYDDGTAASSWSIDLHYPDPENTVHFPDMEFISICEKVPVDYYPIPYRCLYSKNVDNMFMAGRNISVTHVALGTTRVMRTTAMLGEVVGMAASVCKTHDSLPRDVYTDWFGELKTLMEEGCGDKTLPDNQKFNRGGSAKR